MRPACLFLILILAAFATADRRPKRYRIDLDLPARVRWYKVIGEYKEYIPAFAEEARKVIPPVFQPFVYWIAAKLIYLFPKNYALELKGIAAASGLPLGEVVGLNILYDISAFDRKHILNEGCTSIVAQNAGGEVFHGRNLDYEMQELLKNITVLLDFVKDGEVVYSGTSFVLYAGLLTGQRPGGYTVTLNARYAGAYIDNILMEFYTHFRNPVSFVIRSTLETVPTYSSAVEHLSNTKLICPAYIIVGGMYKGQGAVITRKRWGAASVASLSEERWFLVETNFDSWKGDSDKRRITAERLLTKLGKEKLDAQSLMKVLSAHPVNNNLTIYSGVLSAAHPELMADTMRIRT